MTTSPIRYLAAIDEHPDHVIAVAADLAGALAGRAELHVVHVVLPWTQGVPPVLVSYDGIMEEGRVTLDAALLLAGQHFGGSISGHLLSGNPAEEIVSMSEKLGADLVVVGTADKNLLERVAIGSVSQKVVRLAKCPVLVARKKVEVASVAIEPPCPACVEVQNRTKRQELWCERHRIHHPHGATHQELPQSFGLGSMLLRPE